MIGASAGGLPIQKILSTIKPGTVKRVIFLATVFSEKIENTEIPKLFIHTRDDIFSDASMRTYNAASEPKTLLELPGLYHAKDMLDGPNRILVNAAIFSFFDMQ